MENSRNEMSEFMESEIEPFTLLHDILVNWWVILLGALAGAMLTYVVVSVKYVPEYTVLLSHGLRNTAETAGQVQ